MIRLAPLLLAACTGLLEPPGATPLSADYADDYAWTWTACARDVVPAPGVSLEGLTWYVVPAPHPDRTFLVDGTAAWGWYRRSARAIYLADWVVTEPTLAARRVRVHELLHALTGISDHPPLFAACRERLDLAVLHGDLR